MNNTLISDDLYYSELEKIKKLNQKISLSILYYYDDSVIGIKSRKELPPLGLLYLASSASCVCDIQVIPFHKETNLIDLNLSDVQIIALSITSSVIYRHYYQITEQLKATYPHAIIIAGNTHVNIFPEKVLKELKIDGVITGECEFSILKLIHNYLTKPKNQLFDDVPGSYSSLNYSTRGFLNKAYISNLNILPHPLRQALHEDYILLKNRLRVPECLSTKAVTLITSRGCPYSCYFCANINNGSVRYRNAMNVYEELKQLSKDYPEMGGLLIMDETATLNKRHLNEWISVIKDFKLKFVISTRGDTLDLESIKNLSDSGCVEIKFGLETGSSSLLKRMNKNLQLDALSTCLKNCREHNISTKVFLMHGFPGENMSTTKQTIKFLEKNKSFINRAVLYQFSPLPGSYVYENASAFGLKRINSSSSRLTIYENNHHWWGSREQYTEMIEGYKLVNEYVYSNFKR